MPMMSPGSHSGSARVNAKSRVADRPNSKKYQASLSNLRHDSKKLALKARVQKISGPPIPAARGNPTRAKIRSAKKKRAQSPRMAVRERAQALQVLEFVLTYGAAHICFVNKLTLPVSKKRDKDQVQSVKKLNGTWTLVLLRALWMASRFVSDSDLRAVRRLRQARAQRGKAITKQSLGAILLAWLEANFDGAACAGVPPNLDRCVRQAGRFINAALQLGFVEPDPNFPQTRARRPIRATKQLDTLILEATRRTLNVLELDA